MTHIDLKKMAMIHRCASGCLNVGFTILTVSHCSMRVVVGVMNIGLLGAQLRMILNAAEPSIDFHGNIAPGFECFLGSNPQARCDPNHEYCDIFCHENSSIWFAGDSIWGDHWTRDAVLWGLGARF